jgi:glycosyltransferase involved in cell wall biosynthesis
MKLVIISEKTRYHFQKPLAYFSKIEIIHLYKSTYSDSRLNSKNLIQYKNIFQLYSKLKKIKPDLIQGMEPYYGYSRFRIPLKILPILWTTQLYSKLHRRPYFFHCLENIAPERKYGFFCGKIMKFIAKIYALNASFIFYVNNGAKYNLLRLGINPNKISFSLWGIWGVDVDEFQPIMKPQKRIIFIGNLSENKGILDLIRAIARIKTKIKDIKLSVIGTGPLLDDVKKLIADLKLNDEVELTGEVPSDKIAKALADSYLLIAPSIELRYSAEQVGMTMIEAAACGVPVISTNTGSIREFVLNNKTGILVKPGNPQEISEAIIKIWNNKRLHDIMAIDARKNALKNYNSKTNVKKIEAKIIAKFKEIKNAERSNIES